jgi:hypothetical protein
LGVIYFTKVNILLETGLSMCQKYQKIILVCIFVPF